ncbi:MAG: hypothetical protein SH868_09985 [Bythopirellula sp.]|nr:hypothetical protein [Bythopirellula sp.]
MLLEAVQDAYRTANEVIGRLGLAKPERRNLVPWLRRELVETNLRRAALSCRAPIRTDTECSGFWHHVVIDCNRVRITQSSNPDTTSPLRYANYKEEYARQQYLPGMEEAEDALRVYAVVLHHADVNADTPDFVVIRFPEPDLKSYHPGIIDLGVDCSVDEAANETPVEDVADTAMPKIKIKRRRAAGEP